MSSRDPNAPSPFRDDACVLPALARWRAEGRRTALVSLIGIDGRSPRPLGAQMAVADDGRAVGYLSGGCLEAAVVEEARRVIDTGANRMLRFGRGSPYFDLRLPCGSGLDLYFDRGPDDDVLAAALACLDTRRPFVLSTETRLGRSSVAPLDPAAASTSSFENGVFTRCYLPEPRVLLAGGGPAVPALAALMVQVGLAIQVISPDEATREAVAAFGIEALPLPSPDDLPLDWLDAYSAAILAFHEHDWEAPLLRRILAAPSFYVGALGSHTAHAARKEALSALGVAAHDIARVGGPIGLVANARSRVSLAAGILAEVIAAAKARGFID